MLATLFLLVTSLAGFAVATKAVPSAPAIVRIPAGFLLAVVVSSGLAYLIASALAGRTDESLRIALIACTVLGAIVFAVVGRGLRASDLHLPRVDAVLGLLSLGFSWWLMQTHLREDKEELVVSVNTWGDMGLHIGLARSFATGANYPTEYPFFAGESIRYHFGFDFFAGMLQEGGMSVLCSFNLPGILGFTSLLLLTFAFARLLFSPSEPAPRLRSDKGVWVGVLAIALLLTNQSLAWLRYIENEAGGSVWKALSPARLWNHEGYVASGPYDGDRIAIFDTLNPYLGQMHLIIAVAVVLLLAYVLVWQLRAGDQLSKRLLIGAGAVFGAAFWINGVVWVAGAAFLGSLLAIWGVAAAWRSYRQRPAQADADAETQHDTTPQATTDDEGQPTDPAPLPSVGATAVTWLKILACFAVPALALAIPQAIFASGGSSEGGLAIHIGYLVCSTPETSCYEGQMNPLSPADWWSFVEYWWLNTGLVIPLLIAAFVLGNGRDRKIIAAVSAVFLWGSVFQIGLDLGGHNHKVFNVWEVLAGPFAAFAVVELWLIAGRWLRSDRGGRKVIGAVGRAAVVAGIALLTVSGLIDLAVVKNDPRVGVFGDGTQRHVTDWIAHETPPHARFLTDFDQMYTAPTMAGRGVALGYSPWVQTSGYDAEPRKEAVTAIFTATDRAVACEGLEKLEIDYLLIGPQERNNDRYELNEELFNAMFATQIFGRDANEYRIYKVAENC